ncbi:histidine--tRNA ligase [Brachyspira hyodysenteriae]|uniref:Histidine--tRNA ligase n=1 Tax=Brachyspira hyodysenteriae (strain ATCC 49526 / WA1) TaxID=565034 RepID=A0A3B6VAA6_BRAHW|nr:histidine--tRNA ligase [Brachyspira hyodysenteriae]ACN82947.1 Histidyl-tRNA synthetase, class IIa [Brachyspira hyodysenteriae WA1]KLI17676.1 histidyl-tRNA synthetase [Brachyspira hyodysenteriae]KLI24181.1 histidyl-tRNA synthetase [Brachyspira hyodysenteriae]KLI25073.1 histidyl-tRNA synthetase [Brachyspira hyodysenteriae]KLI37889.1 histidyl-tRNA synthetase [Brachyspira hyodysenteriae]
MLDIKKPRGTNDFFYDSSKRLEYIENKIKNIVKLYGYGRIRTPLFEYTDLFTRGIGEGTDIVGKEMFTFEDRGGRSLTLRPEGTASVARAYVENSMQNEFAINKLFYLGTMYRAERPQKGRYREFNQFGVECIGNSSPLIDAEIILLNINVLKEFGIDNVNLLINTVGCSKCKPSYNNALKEAIGSRKEELCETCQKRYEGNILRILDCKNEKCKETIKDIPKFYDYVCDECKEHFDRLCEELTRIGQNFTVDPMLVRGLDYYTKTAFEVQTNALGAQSAILGGGRYDNLIGIFNNGKDVPAVGSAMGIERLLLVLENQNNIITDRLDAFIVAFKETENEVLKIMQTLRANNISCDYDFAVKSIKSQFKSANKRNAKYAVVLGEDEFKRGMCKLKNMDSGEEKEISINDIHKNIEK